MKKSLVFRFWDKFERPKNGCWNWLASLDTSGYGLIKRGGYGRNDSSLIKAHRLSWMLFFGPIPDELCVCHDCDNPKCVNPEHLFLGTAEDNAHDRDRKGRQISFAGEKHWKSKLTKENIIKIRQMRLNKIPNKQIAKMFDICETHTSKIARGLSWKSV